VGWWIPFEESKKIQVLRQVEWKGMAPADLPQRSAGPVKFDRVFFGAAEGHMTVAHHGGPSGQR